MYIIRRTTASTIKYSIPTMWELFRNESLVLTARNNLALLPYTSTLLGGPLSLRYAVNIFSQSLFEHEVTLSRLLTKQSSLNERSCATDSRSRETANYTSACISCALIPTTRASTTSTNRRAPFLLSLARSLARLDVPYICVSLSLSNRITLSCSTKSRL